MGGWNWERLHIELPEEVKKELQATPISYVRRNEDRLAWKPSPRGSFDLKSAYLLAIDPLLDPVSQGRKVDMEVGHLARDSNIIMEMNASEHRCQEVFTSEGDVSRYCMPSLP